MKKLLCDICNAELEMTSNGQSAVCTGCGMAYPVARLKAKLGIAEPVQQAAEEVVYDVPESAIEEVYDVTEFEVVEPDNASKVFNLWIETTFLIEGRGVVVTGIVQDATVLLGDPVTVIRANGTHLQSKVLGIEHNQTLYDGMNPGYGVGILLADIKPDQVSAGDVLTTPSAAAVRKSVHFVHILHGGRIERGIALQCGYLLFNIVVRHTPYKCVYYQRNAKQYQNRQRKSFYNIL